MREGLPLRTRILRDALTAGLTWPEALAYRETILTYLGLAVSNMAQREGTLVTWEPQGEKPRNAFPRQAVQMTWDVAEVNPFAGAWEGCVEGVARTLERVPADRPGRVRHQGAQEDDEDE